MSERLHQILSGRTNRFIILTGIIAIILVMLAAGYVMYQRRNHVDLNIRMEMLQQVIDLAEAIEPENAKNLTFQASDSLSLDYQRIRNQFRAYGRLIHQRGIYTMALYGDNIVFGPENYDAGDPMGAGPPGTIFENPAPEDFSVFKTGNPIVSGPTKDEYGEFISSSAPVFYPYDNSLLLIVGIDIMADEWKKLTTNAMVLPGISALVTVILILTGMIITMMRKKMDRVTQFKLRHVETSLVALVGSLITIYFMFLTYESSRRDAKYFFDHQAQLKAEKIRDKATAIKNEIKHFRESIQLAHTIHPTFDTSNFISKTTRINNGILTMAWLEYDSSKQFIQRSSDDTAKEINALRNSIVHSPKFREIAELTLHNRFDNGFFIEHCINGKDTFPATVLVYPGPRLKQDQEGASGQKSNGVILALIRMDFLVTFYGEYFNNIVGLPGTSIVYLNNGDTAKFISNLKELHPEPDGIKTTKDPASWLNHRKVFPLFLGSCSFAILFQPDQRNFLAPHYGTTWVALFIGVIITLILTLFVRFIRNQQFYLKKEVALQTAELNARLIELTEAKNQVERSDALKTAFLNNISHEIRTPLNGILGFTSLVLKNEITPKEREECLSMIKISSVRLTDTINNYMDISLLVTGNYKVKQVSVNLYSLFYSVCERFSIAGESKKISFEIEVNEEYKNITILVDKDLLSKVIAHFLDNAVKFTLQGKIRTGFFIREQMIRFFFSDTGIGIAKGAQQRIFETFMQEDISHSRGFEGSGLGLSICNEAVKLMGGSIAVESEKGKGSLFSFDIPLVLSKTQQNGMEQAQIKPKAGVPHILIAEDELANALFLHKSLKKEGYQITVVKNGREAVDFCKSNPEISAVLMDIKMPEMDGYEATKLIRKFRKELPVIGVSAFDLHDDQQKALEAGCNDYIPKPVDRDLLLRILSRFIL